MKTLWRTWVIALTVMFFLTPAASSAEDTASLKDEIEALRAQVAALEIARSSAGEAKSAPLTSMRKKGRLTIGGAMEIAVRVINRDDVQNAANRSASDTINSTLFDTPSASLKFKFAASADSYLMLKLDIDDTHNSRLKQYDFFEEVYFRWQHLRGSNWGVRFGKMEIPFGQDKDILLTDGYHHGSMGSYLRGNFESTVPVASGGGAGGNPHGRVGNFRAPFEVDNVFAIEATYKWQDFAKWEMSIFQNRNRSVGTAGRLTRGMYEDRSDDNLLAQSFSGRLTLTPLEGLAIKISGENQHNASRGDQDLYTRGATADQQALSLGFDWKLNDLPLEFFGEYSHGFGWSYNRNYNTNTSQLGTIWGVTKAVDLVLIGEMLNISDDRIKTAKTDEDYYKIAVAGWYKFPSGIRLSIEYIREWYKRDSSAAGGDRRSGADALVFGTKWTF